MPSWVQSTTRVKAWQQPLFQVDNRRYTRSMTIKSFEFGFEIEAPSESQEDSLMAFGGALSCFGGRYIVSVSREGSSATMAAVEAYKELIGEGIKVIRIDPDYVTRAEIAERFGVSAQAVGLWCRGERNSSKPFPKPSVSSSGATLWIWSDIVYWARSVGKPIDEGMEYLSRDDMLFIDGRIVNDRRIEPWGDVSTSSYSLGAKPASKPKVSVKADHIQRIDHIHTESFSLQEA